MNTVIGIVQRPYYWKRLGMAGFTFFLVKGLMWLAVPVMMYLMGTAGQ
jgi:hypothetical protein